jgi:uncharacterized protein (DUF1778 family)
MATIDSQPRKCETVNIRIRPEERGLIDRAARLSGKNRSEFILDAARRTAEETLLDQVLLRIEPEAFAAFLERLDAPAQPNDRLRKTMGITPPWETE